MACTAAYAVRVAARMERATPPRSSLGLCDFAWRCALACWCGGAFDSPITEPEVGYSHARLERLPRPHARSLATRREAGVGERLAESAW